MFAPAYMLNVLSYLNSNYDKKIVASELAKRFYVSRTTLLTGFKAYTGMPLGEYLTRLRHGSTVQAAAEQCGFCDSSGLIRVFKRHYGTSPHRYLMEERNGPDHPR